MLDLANSSETVGRSLAVAARQQYHAGSGTLTVGADNTSTSYAGAISGTGGIVKSGFGTLTLTGTQAYATLTTNGGTTNLDDILGTGASTLNANATTNISVSQTLAALNIGAGAVVTLESGPGAAAFGSEPDKATTDPLSLLMTSSSAPDLLPEIDGSLDGGAAFFAAVPEPGTASALLIGLGSLLGLHASAAGNSGE